MTQLLLGGILVIAGFYIGRGSVKVKPETFSQMGGVDMRHYESTSPPTSYKAEFIMPDRVSEILSKKPEATLDEIVK